jgi:hypothetical protein
MCESVLTSTTMQRTRGRPIEGKQPKWCVITGAFQGTVPRAALLREQPERTLHLGRSTERRDSQRWHRHRLDHLHRTFEVAHRAHEVVGSVPSHRRWHLGKSSELTRRRAQRT